MVYDKELIVCNKTETVNVIGEVENLYTQIASIKAKLIPYTNDIVMKGYGLVEGQVYQAFIKGVIPNKEYRLTIDGEAYRLLSNKSYPNHSELLLERVMLNAQV